jgi:hypothetical protein
LRNIRELTKAIKASSLPPGQKTTLIDQAQGGTYIVDLFVTNTSRLSQTRLDFLRDTIGKDTRQPLDRIVVVNKLPPTPKPQGK